MQNIDDRLTKAKTTDFLRKAEHLRKLIDKHEKDRRLNKHNRRIDLRDCFCVLEELEKKLNMDLKTEVTRVEQQLQRIRNSVYRFQGHLTDVSPSPSLIEKLKESMSEIERTIVTFKEQQHRSFEELLKEERTCWQELGAIDKKIDTWTLTGKSELRTASTKPCLVKKGAEELPVEIMALESFLQQTGGKLGGWDQYDHQSFLKIWGKHHGKASYRSEAKLYLPDKSEEEIRLHEDWYLQLCHLEAKKKEAIKKWRAERQRTLNAHLQCETRDAETQKPQHEAAAAETQHRKREVERREAALRLEAWREERRRQQEQDEEQRHREEALRMKRLKEERRQQQEVKLAVEAHVRQKREEDEMRTLEKEEEERVEMERRRRLAAEGIRLFQERDLHKLETKLQEKQAKEEEELERQRKVAERKDKVECHINRDPSRLCKPTKGWEEHTKEMGPTGGGPVYQMFHRAVPAWRQDL